MKLFDAASLYIAHKQSLGMKFDSPANVLRFFCRTLGDVLLSTVSPDAVRKFIDGVNPITRYWHRKHNALRGFYHFLLVRGHVVDCPLPAIIPKRPPEFVPYIYSSDELLRLLDHVVHSQRSKNCVMEAYTFRALLLTLYGAGLRLNEALAVRLDDVNLGDSILTIRRSKFYKTRLVPIGPHLTCELEQYSYERNRRRHPLDKDAFFFTTRSGSFLHQLAVRKSFRRLCSLAGVHRNDGARYQPRIHDLRHSFACHRLVAWYREGADVQRLLPQLSTYLGHLELSSTQRYLTMTPEILSEASRRFERYALDGGSNE